MNYNEIIDKYNSLSDEEKDSHYHSFAGQGLYFIDPDTVTLEKLEEDWSDFNSMTKPFRRKSDWVHLEYIGIDNETLYNTLKSHLLKAPILDKDLITPDDIDSEIEEYGDTLLVTEATYISSSEDIDYAQVIDNTAPDLTRARELAVKWSRETDFAIIVPPSSPKELEDMWEAYNAMTHKHKRVSDWKAQEIFGLTNLQLYKYFKSLILATPGESISYDDYDDEDFIDTPLYKEAVIKKYFKNHLIKESAADVGRALINLLNESKLSEDNYERIIYENIVKNTLADYNDINQNSLNVQINYSDMPMFTPDEMIDMGVFGHEPVENYFNSIGDDIIAGDSSVLEWFKQYRQIYNGLPISEDFIKLNNDRIKALENIYRVTTIEQRVNDLSLAQHILEMGWSPLYEFDIETRVKADMRVNTLIENGFGSSRVIDLRGFKTLELSKFAINEDSSVGNDGNPLKPIYIVFEEGFSTFSKAIKKVTAGVYSHAAISFDHTMQKIYSYGIEGSANGKKGGFIVENIKDKKKDAHMGVYTVFVHADIWQKIYDNVTYLAQHAKETAYSYVNILTMIFRIPYEKSKNLICSQFVDRMLKLGGIDVTGKPSSLVDPNFLHRVSKAAKDIYRLFEGKVKSFSPKALYNRTYGLLNKISKYKATDSIKENVLNESKFYYDSLNALNQIYESSDSMDPIVKDIYESLYMPCMEAKEIPIRFDKDGDILIDNFRIDYKAEYAKSHKLLVEYEKAKNYKGMKSELSKLWMMNVSIEKKIRNSRFNKARVKYLQDAKALILNDFKKYLGIVMDNEKNFDFEDYFVKSKYYDQTYKVGKDTVKHTINLIKSIV